MTLDDNYALALTYLTVPVLSGTKIQMSTVFSRRISLPLH